MTTATLLRRAARMIADNAETLRKCHTVRGKWADNDDEAREIYSSEMALVAELEVEAERLEQEPAA